MKQRIDGMVAVAILVFAFGARAEVSWPSDFWEKVNATVHVPSGTQVGGGTGTVEIEARTGDSAQVDTLGTEENPFDSRWMTCGTSNAAGIDSRPCGLVLTFR